MTSHSSIMAKLEEKHSKQQIEIVDRFPLMNMVSTNVMLGSFSWYWMIEKRKAILRPYALNFGNVITTPAEISRTYLQLKYGKQRATKEQVSYFKLGHTAPLYAKPHSFENAVYIDLRSAYWQILQIVGWDADYCPLRWLGRGEPMDDFAYADIKLSRNCLVTAGLPTEASFWNGEKQEFQRLSTFNSNANLGIWALTMDILHGIAWDVIAAGAVYAHTDGYICATQNLGRVQEAIGEWGLETRIKKTGSCEVYGVGSYSFGNSATNTPKHKHAYDNLILSDFHQWLRRKIKFFADRTDFIWQSKFLTEKSLNPSTA